MRILTLHNTYQQTGGEDAVVSRELALLGNFGHEVFTHIVSNDTIQGFWSKLNTALKAPYSNMQRTETLKAIKFFQPDVVHVHNFFPLLTPSVYDACREEEIPVVQTLHNYRTICPGGLLMRKGKPCLDCIEGTPYQAVFHGCYRGSRLASLAVANMVDRHRRWDTWSEKVDLFIALTEFSKKKFIEAGFPPEKIVVKPNFVEGEGFIAPVNTNRKGALFVGRLSHEKGIETLLKAWDSLDVPLRTVGEGPMQDRVRKFSSTPIINLGKRTPVQVAEEMSRATLLIMPSECYETCPLCIIEAFAKGLPVIASRLGAMEEIIENNVTGLHFTPGDSKDLAIKVRWAIDHPEEMRRMGHNAHRIYEEKYTAEINYRQLMAVYEGAIEENLKKKSVHF